MYTEIGLQKSWDIDEFHNIPFLFVFIKLQVRNTPISWFAKLAVKYPYYQDIWNTA